MKAWLSPSLQGSWGCVCVCACSLFLASCVLRPRRFSGCGVAVVLSVVRAVLPFALARRLVSRCLCGSCSCGRVCVCLFSVPGCSCRWGVVSVRVAFLVFSSSGWGHACGANYGPKAIMIATWQSLTPGQIEKCKHFCMPLLFYSAIAVYAFRSHLGLECRKALFRSTLKRVEFD